MCCIDGNPKTDNLLPTLSGLAHCVRRYTARTATLCHTTATAARAGIRTDLFGSRGGVGTKLPAGDTFVCAEHSPVGGRPRRSDCPVMAVVAGVPRHVLPLFDAGAIRVVVDTVVPLHAYLVDRVHGVQRELLRLNVVRERSVRSVKLRRMACRA